MILATFSFFGGLFAGIFIERNKKKNAGTWTSSGTISYVGTEEDEWGL